MLISLPLQLQCSYRSIYREHDFRTARLCYAHQVCLWLPWPSNRQSDLSLVASIVELSFLGSLITKRKSRVCREKFRDSHINNIAAVLLVEVFPDMYTAMLARIEHAA